MKGWRRILALLLCLCMAAGLLCGCAARKTEDIPAEPTPDPAELLAEQNRERYRTAADALAAAENLVMELKICEDRTVGGDSVHEESERSARYQGLGTGAMIADVEETISLGTTRAAYDLLYADGTIYAKIKANQFCSSATEEDFLAQQLPAVMLHPELYEQMQTEETGEGTRFLFSDALEAEGWAMPCSGELLEAEGSATLSEEGHILSASYHIRYAFGGSEIETDYEALLDTPEELALEELVPANKKGYESIESVEAAVTVLRTGAALKSATVISTNLNQTVEMDFAGFYTRIHDSSDRYGSGEDAMFHRSVQENMIDLNTGKNQQGQMELRYRDGALYYAENGGELEPLEDKIELEYVTYYMEMQLGCLPLYSDLLDAEIIEVDDYYLINFACGDEYGDRLRQETNVAVFNDAQYLDGYATAYRSTKMEGYLAVEKYTWLPTALGVSYAGVYTIEGEVCELRSELVMGISLCDPDTYESITEEPLPDTEPERHPTPLFYEVTGEHGEKMYLFGTIHVGDDRTAFLPQEILDALEASDALAVEFDGDAFTDSLAEDPDALQAVAEAYYYTDGTGLPNHVDSELYKEALNRMKVSGSYSTEMDYARPFLWSSMIENFYLAQGRSLNAAKGVDNRLLRMAREANKEILDVESGQFQLDMMAGYSDEVQQAMLAGTVFTSRADFLRGSYELYERWCEGNEEELIEQLREMNEEERAEIDEDDLAIYDEYHQKMEVERNAHMLEVAEGYLNGEKTVFFAVGLAHLLGEGGLVEALRGAGYTVTRAVFG